MIKHYSMTIVIVCTFLIPGVSLAEYYKVYVKRVEKDLYKTQTGVYIKTKYCYEYSYGEEAILKYEDYSYDNKLIFESDNTCDVDSIFK